MEKYNDSFPPIKSLAEEFSKDAEAFNGMGAQLFELYSHNLKNKPNFEKNMKQLVHMAEITANPDDIYDKDSITNFAAGELLGYTALIKLEGDDSSERVYESLKDLYSLSRMRANNYINEEENPIDLTLVTEEHRELVTGVFIKDIADSHMDHESIPNDELEVVIELIRNLTGDEDESDIYDTLRGYLFIRSSLKWHDSYADFRNRQRSDAESAHLSEVCDFYELLSDVEIDKNVVEGKFDVTDSIATLMAKFHKDADKIIIPDKWTIDDMITMQAEVENTLRIATFEMKDLPMKHRIAIEGKGVIMTADSNGALQNILPIYESTVIEGTFVDLQTQAVPVEKSINTAYKRISEGKIVHLEKSSMNPLGVALQIEKVVALHKLSNNYEVFTDELNYYIPLNYEGTRVYKVMVDKSDAIIERYQFASDDEED